MFNIITKTLKNEFFCENNLILKYKIVYPQIIGNYCSYNKFNNFNLKKALEFQKYIEDSLLQEARKSLWI